MNDTIINHVIKQGVFNDTVSRILEKQIKINKASSIFIIACGICLYFNNKKISKLTSEIKELRQTKGA